MMFGVKPGMNSPAGRTSTSTGSDLVSLLEGELVGLNPPVWGKLHPAHPVNS